MVFMLHPSMFLIMIFFLLLLIWTVWQTHQGEITRVLLRAANSISADKVEWTQQNEGRLTVGVQESADVDESEKHTDTARWSPSESSRRSSKTKSKLGTPGRGTAVVTKGLLSKSLMLNYFCHWVLNPDSRHETHNLSFTSRAYRLVMWIVSLSVYQEPFHISQCYSPFYLAILLIVKPSS